MARHIAMASVFGCVWLGCADPSAGEQNGGSSSGDDGPQSSTSSAWTPGTSSTSTTAPATDTTDGSGSDDTSEDSADTSPTPMCGDGLLDDGEVCDDGNDDDGDGCTSRCTIPGIAWSVIEDSLGQVFGLATDADGNIVAVGSSGDPNLFEPTPGLFRTFSADGELLSSEDDADYGGIAFFDIDRLDDGDFMIYGAATADPGRALMRRVGAAAPEDWLFDAPTWFRAGVPVPDGHVVVNVSELALVDNAGDVQWLEPFAYADNVAVDATGAIAVLVGESYDAPRSLVVYDASGAQIDGPLEIGGVDGSLLALADGGWIVGTLEDASLGPSTVRRLDADLVEQWSAPLPELILAAIAETADGFVLGGSHTAAPDYWPRAMGLDGDGNATWYVGIAPGPEYITGRFRTVHVADDGTILAGGYVVALDDVAPRALVAELSP
jgi:cysteine-rich repeat protein